MAEYQKALDIGGNSHRVLLKMGRALDELGKTAEALEAFREALKVRADDCLVRSSLLYFLSAHLLYSPRRSLEEHREWGTVYSSSRNIKPFEHSRKGGAEKRLRIGYVSPDFRQHPVATFIEPVLENHSREGFEVFCYSGVATPDGRTTRLQSLSEHWRSIAGLRASEAARIIIDDRIDILVDLAGHTSSDCLKVFAWKPAPVQATYLGYRTTTGLATMDYWITDPVLHPPNTVEQASETIWRLPRCWVCFTPPAEAPEVVSRPLDDAAVIFGCFSKVTKISSEVVELWSRILTELSGSKIFIKWVSLVDSSVRERLFRLFEKHGVARDRVRLEGRSEYREYLSSYGDIDITLDPFPRTGGMVTAESLWMGVPVVTLAGERYTGRISASKLTELGKTEWIASTPDEYVSIAVGLAKDRERLARERRTLRERMRRSGLCDGRAMAKTLEEAYREMWRDHLAGAEAREEQGASD